MRVICGEWVGHEQSIRRAECLARGPVSLQVEAVKVWLMTTCKTAQSPGSPAPNCPL